MPPKKKGNKRGDDSDEEISSKLSSAKIQDDSANDRGKKGDKEKDKKKGNGAVAETTTDKSKPSKAPKDKKKGKGRGHESSDDEDPLAAMRRVAREDDSDEDVPAALTGKKIAPAQAAPAGPSNAGKKDKKAQKRAGKGRVVSDSDGDGDPLALMKKAAGLDVEEDSEVSEDEKPVLSSKAVKQTKGKKSKAAVAAEEDSDEEVAPAPALAPAPAPAPAPVESASKARLSKAERKRMKSGSRGDAPTSTSTSADPVSEDEEDSSMVPSNPESAVADSQKDTAREDVVESQKVPAPATAAVEVSAKPVKKSKLELKLEKLRQESELSAKLAQAKKAEEDAAAAVVAREKAQAEAAAKAEAEAEAARLNAAAAVSAAAEEKEAAEEEVARKSKKAVSLPAAAMDPEAEARMRATMFGDEVHSEYGNNSRGGNQGDSDEDEEGEGEGEGEAASGSSKRRGGKADRLSNKAKRKQLKEAEAKEREKEYNRVAMIRSAEGAQFAVSQSIIDPNDPQWQNALDIIIPSVSISAHSKELLVNTELNIVHGRRYGLVGPNGAGKSTLLKMIAAGELQVPPRVDHLYVEQEVVADETPAVDAVLKADKVRWNLVAEEKKLLQEIEQLGATEARDVRLGEVYEELDAINASAAEARARRILFGLGFDAEMQVRPTKYFSGGWRMRISLARALFIEPTLLMLDEPTNHLDLNAVIWLDDYLQKWKKTLLVVSHDQDFLNSVCEEIVHLENKKLVVYKGNYDTFKEQEAVKHKQLIKAWEKQEKKLRELKAKGITKQNAEKEQIKSKSREPGARSNKRQDVAAAASGGKESGESQVELIARPRDYTVVFSFPEVVQISPPILEVRDVNFRYSPTLPWLFRGLNFGLDMGSRVCIVGPNGSGKSTIIKLITEEVTPPEGEVRRNPRLRVGVYNQHFVDRLPMEEDPVTYLRRLFSDQTYQSCRNILGKYGLEGHAHTIPIRDLSGGQKARVVFVELSLMAPHLLFLDEPTNNLDIESIDALCDALKHYNGGVVLVSHDARLIETTDCRLWVVEDHNVTPWASGFADYRANLLQKLEDQLATIIPGGGERPGEKKK